MKKYIYFLSKTPDPLFIIYIVAQYLFVGFALDVALTELGVPERSGLTSMPAGLLFFVGVALAPIFETLICQVIPYFLLGKFKMPGWVCFIGMWAAFIGVHVTAGLAAMCVAGFVGGFFLSLSYFIKYNESPIKAYAVTVFCHAISNMIAICLLLKFSD